MAVLFQFATASRNAILFTSIALLCACTQNPPQEDDSTATAEPAPVIVIEQAPSTAPAPTMTAAPEVECNSVLAESLVPGHPDFYVVVKGDTLWDISATFLSKPWYWPEIWHINQQIENPHLIYPGDRLNLVYDANGCPQLALTRNSPSATSGVRGKDGKLSPSIRELPLDEAITTIPYEAIASFVSKPSVLTKDQLKSAPYVLSIREHHLIAGAGNDLYVRGPDPFQKDERYVIYNIGDPLVDPDNGDVLGFQALYAGDGRVTRTGDPATVRLLASGRETLVGDRLIKADNDQPLNFLPHSPADDAEGTIIAVLDGVALIGQYQVVALNRGHAHDIELGHVFSVWQAGEKIRDRFAREHKSFGFGSEKVKLPEERAGLLMIFKAYERMSYGLIMRASSEIKVGDKIRNPNL